MVFYQHIAEQLVWFFVIAEVVAGVFNLMCRLYMDNNDKYYLKTKFRWLNVGVHLIIILAALVIVEFSIPVLIFSTLSFIIYLPLLDYLIYRTDRVYNWLIFLDEDESDLAEEE